MNEISRRGWLGLAGGALAGMAAVPAAANASSASGSKGPKAALETRPYVLPDLPYPADALEPHIDAQTLTIHHDKHHAGYVKGLNATLEKLERANREGDFSGIQDLARALAFHGSGHVLHTLYFSNLAPASRGGRPEGALRQAIESQFGSREKLEAQLVAASAKVAGSGWGLLAYEPMGGRLLVLQVEKHENQLLAGCTPLLVIDVWEHAYYLKYQNRRGDYLEAAMKLIDWAEVGRRFRAAAR